MKKTFNRIIISCFSLLLFAISINPISAQELNHDLDITSIDSQEIPTDVNFDAEITPMSYIEISRKKIKTTFSPGVSIGWAANQPAGGYKFSGSTGSICHVDSGYNVSVGLGATYNWASVSVSVGYSSGGVGAVCATNLAPNVGWKLYIKKDLYIHEYEVTYLYYGATVVKTEYVAVPHRTILEPRRV